LREFSVLALILLCHYSHTVCRLTAVKWRLQVQ